MPITFESSLDFEAQFPSLSQASASDRGTVDLEGVRQSIRRLFALFRNEDQEREAFLHAVRDGLTEAVGDDVWRQMRQRVNAYAYWEARGGQSGGTRAEVSLILSRFRRWLSDELEGWLRTINPLLDPDAWIGHGDETGGLVDTLLLADAIGLHAYSWNCPVDRSPFRRLDIVMGADPALVVLLESYSQSIPMTAYA